MYKAPSIQMPRQVYDSHGHHLGRSDGFHPDPDSGGLGIELELEEEAQNLLDTDMERAWLPADNVEHVRRDRIILDLTLLELRLLLRGRSLWAEGISLDPERVAP